MFDLCGISRTNRTPNLQTFRAPIQVFFGYMKAPGFYAGRFLIYAVRIFDQSLRICLPVKIGLKVGLPTFGAVLTGSYILNIVALVFTAYDPFQGIYQYIHIIRIIV